MTEGIAVTPGSGATLAADPCTVYSTSVIVPQCKVGYGDQGSYTDVSLVHPLPVGGNTVKDGSGTEYALLVDTNGRLQTGVVAQTTGGATPGKLISAASTNSTNVKGSAGTLYTLIVTNINASPRYLKIYDKATAPTVGTDTPKWTIMVPGNTAGAGVAVPIPAQGIAFANGIGLGMTTGSGDSDTGAVGSGDLIVDYAYQ